MAAIQQKLTASDERLDQINVELREGKLQGLSPEDQAALRKNWDLEDREKAVERYQSEVEGYHSDVEVVHLLNDYKQFGVTEEMLQEISLEERELFCERTRADYLAEMMKGGQPNNGQTQQAPPPATPPTQQQVPAGASAPSDTGGGGIVQQPPEPDKGQGPDAMAANIGQGWEQANFPRRG